MNAAKNINYYFDILDVADNKRAQSPYGVGMGNTQTHVLCLHCKTDLWK